MAKCDGPNCDADIVWAETPEGKRQPFDREPTSNGNRILLGRGPDRAPLALDINVLVGGPVDIPHLHDGLRSSIAYMPHHATCSDAKRYRR